MNGIRNRANQVASDSAWIVGTLTLGLGFIAVAIVASPIVNDDIVNIDVRFYADSIGLSLPEFILKYTSEWMTSQGRFFPGSLSWTYGMFWLTQDVLTYKLILAVLLGFAFVGFTLLIRRLSGSAAVAGIAGFALLATIQIRAVLDGLTSFTGLLPLVIGLCVWSLLILLVGQANTVSLIVCSVLISFALVTYEVVILLVPLLCIAAFLKTRKMAALVPFVLPSLVVAVISVVLRSGVSVSKVAPAYEISMNPVEVIRTFVYQVIGTIPGSQWLFNSPNAPHYSWLLFMLVAVVLAVPIFVSVWILLDSLPESLPRRLWVYLVSAGLWVLISTGAITAITARWQSELVLGNSYLNVNFGYFGMSMVIAALIILIEIFIRGHLKTYFFLTVMRSITVGVMTLIILASLAGNFSIVTGYAGV